MLTRVCTIGGGSGMPVVNQALVKGGFTDIKSIVTTFDSGGDTGRMRTDERGKMLAFSDYWRSLMSLWEDGQQKIIWEEMLKYRDGRNRNFGNLFFQFMAERTGNLSRVDTLFCSLTKACLRGEVIPVSLDPAELCFQTRSGKKYVGEYRLDEMRMSSDRVIDAWLEPAVGANPEALTALKESEVIIICPGSMYGSIMANFLPTGMKEAFQKSKARKVLMTNIMSIPNENNGFDQDDYASEFEKYLGKDSLFDLILMPDLSVFNSKLLKKVKRNYEYEYSYPILNKPKSRIKTVVKDIATIEKVNLRLRHSVTKLAKIWPLLLE